MDLADFKKEGRDSWVLNKPVVTPVELKATLDEISGLLEAAGRHKD